MMDANPAAGGITDDLASAEAEYNAIIADACAAYARTRHGAETVELGRAEFRDGAWHFVTAFGRLREFAQKNDRAFGAALKRHPELDAISRDDRTAAISMSRYPDITQAVLATTKRTSLQNIWRKEVKPQVDRIAKDKKDANAAKDADAKKDPVDDDRSNTDDDHAYDTQDEDDADDGDEDVNTDDSDENVDTDDDQRPPRESRNRICPILAPLLEAVNGVGKGLREWGKRKSNWAYYAPDELAHAVTVKAFDLWIAKVCDDDDKLALLREQVEAARVSRQQSEATPDGSVPNSEPEAMAAE
jgi:hypothetical protein